MKLRTYKNNTSGEIGLYEFWCPGCKTEHGYEVPRWGFNGVVEKPSFAPSLLSYPNHRHGRCHLFLTDGKLTFCADCDHDLRGLTVDLPDLPTDRPSWAGEPH